MSKCWYCNEELTTANYCDEHIGICAKCYASMFKVSNDFVKGLTDKIADLEAKLAESEKENKTLKDIRTLERVVPRNAQLHKLSNRDCYLKGFENAISETIRTFEETYGKEKCKLVEERDKYLMDIVKVGGYEYQIEELKQQLAKSVAFPKLEKDHGHNGYWYLYELDYKGDICCTSFEATKEEAEQELHKAQHEDKGE